MMSGRGSLEAKYFFDEMHQGHFHKARLNTPANYLAQG